MLLNIDLSKLLVDALPAMLRKPRMLAWLESLIKPIKELYQIFSDFVVLSRAQVGYNSQTIVFEGALNDLFDPALRRIYIENNPAAPDLAYEYARAEGEPDVLEYSRADGEPDEIEYSSFEYLVPVGFRVVVPSTLAGSDKALRTFIEKVKFLQIRYEVKYL
jgi:hypothetical protein